MKIKDLPTDQVQDIKTLLQRAAQRWTNQIAVRFDPTEESLTFKQLDQVSGQIANTILGFGINPGDRVAIMLRNQPMWPLLWFGVMKSGAVTVPLNVYYQSTDAGYLLSHSGARLIFCESEFVSMLEDILTDSERSDIPHIIPVDESLVDLVQNAPNIPPCAGIIEKTLVSIQYTSGTTGQPKGCMLSHEWFLRFAQRMEHAQYGLSETDILFTAQPFYYVDPQWNLVLSLLIGAELVVADRFHPSTFWKAIVKYRVTWFYCLGVMPNLLLKSPPEKEDQNHQIRFVACSAIPPGLPRIIEQRWGVPWYECFGMTESGLDIVVETDEHDELVGSGCMGRPMTTREARVVDEMGNPISPGQVGELIIRGPGFMLGYFRDPKATARTLKNGWLHTGDLAKTDEKGRLYFVGRIKDMIRRAGENIAAAEIEAVLMQHPAVKLVACVAVPDEVRGEEIKSYIVLQAGFDPKSITPAILAAYCETKVAYFKVPRYWCFLEDLPRTPSEKIIKSALTKTDKHFVSCVYDRQTEAWIQSGIRMGTEC